MADAFARIEDPAERVRLAFKLFNSEGVALVNLLSDGSGALEEMRERARDLGIVLDEHLVRDAERAKTAARHLEPGDLGQPDAGGARGGSGDRRPLRLAPRRHGEMLKVLPCMIAAGDDAQTQFQLVKHYPSGSVIEVRTITRPVAGTVKLYLDDIQQASGWSVDTDRARHPQHSAGARRRGHRRLRVRRAGAVRYRPHGGDHRDLPAARLAADPDRRAQDLVGHSVSSLMTRCSEVRRGRR